MWLRSPQSVCHIAGVLLPSAPLLLVFLQMSICVVEVFERRWKSICIADALHYLRRRDARDTWQFETSPLTWRNLPKVSKADLPLQRHGNPSPIMLHSFRNKLSKNVNFKIWNESSTSSLVVGACGCQSAPSLILGSLDTTVINHVGI